MSVGHDAVNGDAPGATHVSGDATEADERKETADTEGVVTPRPRPTTWQQEVLAAGPDEPIRLTPEASDWVAQSIVIGRDSAGKFLGRVTVRYTGPGSAEGTFAVSLVKDGTEITTLSGRLSEVRSGTYQVMVGSAASWIEGPWTTQFRVISTG